MNFPSVIIRIFFFNNYRQSDEFMGNSCSPSNYFDQLGGNVKELGIVCIFIFLGEILGTS